VVHCIIVGEYTGTDGLKYFMLCFVFKMAANEIEISDLHETFLDFLF